MINFIVHLLILILKKVKSLHLKFYSQESVKVSNLFKKKNKVPPYYPQHQTRFLSFKIIQLILSLLMIAILISYNGGRNIKNLF